MKHVKPAVIRQILMLHESGNGYRMICERTGCSTTTIGRIIKKCKELDIAADTITEERYREILDLVYPGLMAEKESQKPEPDWENVHHRLTTTRHTLTTLWQEYLDTHPDGYSYGRFCQRYGKWRGMAGTDLSMPQNHEPGQVCCVDWAGDKVICVRNPDLIGNPQAAHFFVGVLSFSSYAHVEAFPDEKQRSWSLAHIHMYERFGGSTSVLTPDNCRTAIVKSNLWDPVKNQIYKDLADHYNTSIVPARVREARDKAVVEGSIRYYESWILQKVRDRVNRMGLFRDFTDLNRYITENLDLLMVKGFQKRPGSRLTVFAQIEKPKLRLIPDEPFDILERFEYKLPNNYHVPYRGHYYSAPYIFYKQNVELAGGLRTLKIFAKNGSLIAVHPLAQTTYPLYITRDDHMPQNHLEQQRYFRQDGAYYRAQASKVGESCFRMIDALLKKDKFEETAFKSCQGILSAARNVRIGSDRVEQACAKCLALDTIRYASFKSIISKHLEDVTIASSEVPAPLHRNLRGPEEFV